MVLLFAAQQKFVRTKVFRGFAFGALQAGDLNLAKELYGDRAHNFVLNFENVVQHAVVLIAPHDAAIAGVGQFDV